MSVARLSPYQHSILKSVHTKPLAFDRAIELNQNNFYSLIRRGFIHLRVEDETFRLTDAGKEAYDQYTQMTLGDMVVQHNPLARVERVSVHLQGRKYQKRAAKSSKSQAA